MLQQFISLQRGRIHHRLPDCIIIDSELTEGQNEERWWTHRWGLVRQDMRASYSEVSDQVIDGPIHDLYRAHHHDMTCTTAAAITYSRIYILLTST